MRHTLFCGTVLSIAALAAAPTIAGEALPPPAWSAAVEQLAANFTADDPAGGGIDVALGERAALRTFDGREAAADQLQALIDRADWTHTMAYHTTPSTLAQDIARAVEDAPVPAQTRAYFTPRDEATMRQADITAMRWVAAQLKARVEQPIGVILLHVPERATRQLEDDDAPRPAGRLVIVLVAGEQSGRDRFRFRQVAFGSFELDKK